MDTRLNFDTIHLVEWLRVDDGRTGWEVFNEIEPIGLVSRPPVSVKYSRLSSRADMIALLRTVAADVQRHRTAPILHIETHGDSNGIGISDHDGLLWSDFMRELIPINEAMKVNLFVILAACEGVWGIQMLQPADRAAFRALIRERLFFIDRFPENDARFDAVTFEECSRPDF